MKRALLISHFRNENINVITDGRMASFLVQLNEDKLAFSITTRAGKEYAIELSKAGGSFMDIQKGNVLLKTIIVEGNKKMMTWKKSFFDAENTEIKGTGESKIRICEGFSSTLNVYNDSTYLVVDKSFRVFRDESYFDLIKGRDQEEVKREFQPTTVFIPYSKKLEHIDDIDYDKSPMTTFFDKKKNKEVTFIDYYRDKYKIEIKNKDQPLLVQKKKIKDSDGKEKDKEQKIYFIPELVKMTGLSLEMRGNRKFMKDISDKFNSKPDDKMNDLKNIVQKKMAQLPKLKEWNIKIKPEAEKITAYKLKNPKIYFDDDVLSSTTDWNKEMKKSKLKNLKPLNDWCAIASRPYKNNLYKIVDSMESMCNRCKCVFEKPKIKLLNGSDIDETLNDVFEKYKFVFCIVDRDELYEKIKKLSVDKKVPTQCIRLKTILSGRNLNPIVSMMLLQIQSKLGGSPWTVDIDPYFSKNKDTMVIGIDVVVCTPQREIITVCYSMNNELTSYKKSMFIEKKGLHLSGLHMDEAIKSALNDWKNANGDYPKKIVIYRGSANTGDLKSLREGEVVNVRNTIQEITPDTNMIYIVVNNKHDLKFFTKDANSKFDNPDPSTVICETVTVKNSFQFFLISHKPKKGMVKPSFYVVLENTMQDMSANKIFNLTYQLCFLFYNTTNTVCYPSPLYQANKYAKMLSDCGYVSGTKRIKPSTSSGHGGPKGGGPHGRGDGRDDKRGRGDRRDHHYRSDSRTRRDDRHRGDDHYCDDRRRDRYKDDSKTRRDDYHRGDDYRDERYRYRRDEYRDDRYRYRRDDH